MYAAIAIRPNWLFSHSKYLDSSLLVFSLCTKYIKVSYLLSSTYFLPSPCTTSLQNLAKSREQALYRSTSDAISLQIETFNLGRK